MSGTVTTPKPRVRSARRKRRPAGRGRRLAGAAIVLAVAAAGCALYLDVSVTQRFEGRLWRIPARVYSDSLSVKRGDRIDRETLVRRLARSGYARTEGPPRRPGQYRLGPSTLEVQTRRFSTERGESPVRSAQLRFGERGIESVRDGRGLGVSSVVFEPELLATLYGARQEEREVVPLGQVPELLRLAVLAAEDSRFSQHRGLDARGILRAAWTNLVEGQIVQGGSTITQQTAKNLFLGGERTWWRKGREAAMSLLLEAHYPKDRILEVYLNEVYLGQRGPVAVCGVQAASRFYFGRDVSDLSLGEAALLAGLIRSPGRYNPFSDAEAALERRGQVLDAMQRLAFATPKQVADARSESLELASGSGGFSSAPWAVDYVRSVLLERFGDRLLEEDDLRVETTIDTLWQERGERALRSGLERLERATPALSAVRGRFLEGTVVITEPGSGNILALIGGRDHSRSQFNRAVQARRQPGSCFKPFVYAAGFEQLVSGRGDGLTPASLLDDSPIELDSGGKTWRPANHDGQFRGWVTARRALEESLNVPTVRAAQIIGLEEVISTSRRMGIESSLAAVPSLALGVEEVTPLELSTAYATLARSGRHVPPRIVRRLVRGGEETRPIPTARESLAISPQAAYMVNDILQGVLEHGTAGSAARLGYRGGAAGKTGTTDDTRDAWFVGYTPEVLALVWVGFDDNTRTGLSGASGALPIWVDLMGQVGTTSPEATFPEPANLVRVRVDPATGDLAASGCPERFDEWFVRGSEPTQFCREHGGKFRRWLDNLLGSRSRGV